MNPFAPAGVWLDAVATDDGYEAVPEPGDTGEQRIERDGTTYRVTVEVLDQ